MNAVELRDRIDYYNDLTRSARFSFADYNNVVNSVISDYVDEELGLSKDSPRKGFQVSQTSRDRLHTLIKTATPAITTGTVITGRYGSYTPCTIAYPADYQNFVQLHTLIDGYTEYSRPMDYNDSGPLLDNTFMKPTNRKTYYNENATGLTILRGTGGTFSSATLTYLKTPATYSLSTESNIKTAGQNLTVATYYALETTVFMGVTYLSGASITGSVNPITSGSAILASLTTACDLPAYTHDEIAKLASSVMLGVTANYNSSAFVEKEANKNL